MPCPGAVPGCSASGCARQRPALRKLARACQQQKPCVILAVHLDLRLVGEW